jgi:DNA-binding response OmpR family regulator
MIRMIVNYLDAHDMQAASVAGCDEMTKHLLSWEPDLVILDLDAGQASELRQLRDIRSRSNIPVIIIGHNRSDKTDIVVGLELGADDWLVRPFGLPELLARVRAKLRRRLRCGVSPRNLAQKRLRFAGWHLDRLTRRLTNPDGAPVALTKGLFALLCAFLDAPQRPLTRAYLQQATRVHEDLSDRSVDVQILRLRRKLQIDPGAPSIIQTLRGAGYVFTVPVASS